MNQFSVRKQGTGLMLIPRRVVQQERVIREGSTGRIVAREPNVLMLLRVWAVAEVVAPTQPETIPEENGTPKVELAFYRKYTEAMLRRYLRYSMQAGRVPSLLGRELFQGNVTSYRLHSFEDAVIFCFDVEKRIALQQYSQGEAAGMLGLSLRNAIRQYGRALDRLTGMFLEAEMLEPLKSCQGGRGDESPRSASF
jgi:hypothetical protein